MQRRGVSFTSCMRNVYQCSIGRSHPAREQRRLSLSRPSRVQSAEAMCYVGGAYSSGAVVRVGSLKGAWGAC
jgi:hypothetical protein